MEVRTDSLETNCFVSHGGSEMDYDISWQRMMEINECRKRDQRTGGRYG